MYVYYNLEKEDFILLDILCARREIIFICPRRLIYILDVVFRQSFVLWYFLKYFQIHSRVKSSFFTFNLFAASCRICVTHLFVIKARRLIYVTDDVG